MRVLIITQYFYPENFRINELARELVNRGYIVDALVVIPNYPEGKYFSGYGLFQKRHETVDGINIYRCFQTPRGKKSKSLYLSINYLTFMMSACLWVLLKFAWKKKYDAVIAFEPSPITQIVPAILLGKIRDTKVLSWIQDVWPDSMGKRTTSKLGKIVYNMVDSLTEFVYRNSDKILVSSKGMIPLVNRHRDYSDKIEYVPNWCDDFSSIKGNINIETPSGINLMMAGSINEGIGIDGVIKLLIELSKVEGLNVLFAGGGSQKQVLETKTKALNINNVCFLGSFAYSDMSDVYAKADALLLTLRETDKPHLNATVPSRLQAYMSAGKPVFAMIGFGAAELIKDADCGFVANAGDYKQLVQLIKDNIKDKALLEQKGRNARLMFEREFTVEKGTSHFEALISCS